MSYAHRLTARQQAESANALETPATVLARLLRRIPANSNAGVQAMPYTRFIDHQLSVPAVFALAPTVLIVPGLNGSGPEHWQSAWERERSDCLRADLGDWDDPTPARWVARLEAAVRGVSGPVVIAAHSLGCIATALWAYARNADDRVVGALLVAPCDPEAADACARLRRFAPAPRTPLPFPSTVVASTDDAYATEGRSREMAAAWGSDFVNAGALGHINARSNLGAWTDGQKILDKHLDSHKRLP